MHSYNRSVTAGHTKSSSAPKPPAPSRLAYVTVNLSDDLKAPSMITLPLTARVPRLDAPLFDFKFDFERSILEEHRAEQQRMQEEQLEIARRRSSTAASQGQKPYTEPITTSATTGEGATVPAPATSRIETTPSTAPEPAQSSDLEAATPPPPPPPPAAAAAAAATNLLDNLNNIVDSATALTTGTNPPISTETAATASADRVDARIQPTGQQPSQPGSQPVQVASDVSMPIVHDEDGACCEDDQPGTNKGQQQQQQQPPVSTEAAAQLENLTAATRLFSAGFPAEVIEFAREMYGENYVQVEQCAQNFTVLRQDGHIDERIKEALLLNGNNLTESQLYLRQS